MSTFRPHVEEKKHKGANFGRQILGTVLAVFRECEWYFKAPQAITVMGCMAGKNFVTCRALVHCTPKRSAAHEAAAAAAEAKVAASALAAAEAEPAAVVLASASRSDMRMMEMVRMQGTNFVTWRAVTKRVPTHQHSHGSNSRKSKGGGIGTGSSSSSLGISSSSNGDVGLIVALPDHPALPAEVANCVPVLHRCRMENFDDFKQNDAHLWLYVQSTKKQKPYCTKEEKTTSRPACIPKRRGCVRRREDDKAALFTCGSSHLKARAMHF